MNPKAAAAVAAALVLGALGGATLVSSAGEQPASVFTPITPCRLLDTRPTSQIGGLTTFGAGKVRVADTWGENGNCTLPTGTTAIAANVTSVGGTQPSFLTIWPSDAAARPLSSNLNWIAGQAPTPNKVDVALSSKGRFSMYNLAGNVDVIVDVVGYYTPAAVLSQTVTVVTALIDIEPTTAPGDVGSNGQAIANCPTGQIAISGGISVDLSIPLNMRSSRPNPKNATSNPTGWFGDVRAPDDRSADTATVYVMCVSP